MKNSVNKKTNINIVKYVETAFVTFLAVSVVVVFSLFTSYKNVENKLKKSVKYNEKIEYYMVGLMIEQTKYFQALNPYDYTIDARLGYLYMLYKEYENSEKAYKMAIEKMPNNVYEPYQGLALVYIRQNKYEEAENLINSLNDKPNEKLIDMKGELYEKLGNCYYKDGYYYQAAKKFERSLFYYTKLKKKPKETILRLNECIATSYMNLADMFLDEGKYDYTVKLLNKAEEYMPDSIAIKYKKALALLDSDPEQAEKLMDIVFKKDPEHTNFYIYYDLLKKLVIKSYNAKKFAEAKLYKYKAEKLTEFVQDNIIYKNEIAFDAVEAYATIKKKKANIVFKFKIRNLSRLDLRKLHVNIIFKNNDQEIYRFEQELFNNSMYLTMHEETPVLDIKLEKPIKISSKNKPNLTANVELYKNPKYIYKIGVYSIPINKN